MRVIYFPGQGFEVCDYYSPRPGVTRLTYEEYEQIPPLFQPVLYAACTEALKAPWQWIDAD